jgi:hypothetical protein
MLRRTHSARLRVPGYSALCPEQHDLQPGSDADFKATVAP